MTSLASFWAFPRQLLQKARCLYRSVANALFNNPGFDKQAFDVERYLKTYPEAAVSQLAPIDYFLTVGFAKRHEGYFLDCAWYLTAHPDVLRSGVHPAKHYFKHGRTEGRTSRFVKITRDLTPYEAQNGAPSPTEVGGKLSHSPNIPEVSPLFSVILPVYNSNITFLRACINSVLDQSFCDFELCIADDASETEVIRNTLEDIANKDNRVKFIIRPKNGHISNCSNSALSLCNGLYVVFIDHDDLLSKDALEKMADALKGKGDFDVLYSDEDKIDEYEFRYSPHIKGEFNYPLLISGNYISHLCVIRRDLVMNVGGLRSGVEGAQDHDLLLRLLSRYPDLKIGYVPKVLYHWRATTGSTALTLDAKNYANPATLKSVSDHVKSCLPLLTASLGRMGRARLVCANDTLPLSVTVLIYSTGYGPAQEQIAPLALRLHQAQSELAIARIRTNPADCLEAKLDAAIRAANTQWVFLLREGLCPQEDKWLETLVALGESFKAATVGAGVGRFPGEVDSIALRLDALLGAVPVRKKDFWDASVFDGRAACTQFVSANTFDATLIRKCAYLEAGAFRVGLTGRLFAADFCLRAATAGGRHIWTSSTTFAGEVAKSIGDQQSEQLRFSKLWGSNDLIEPYLRRQF